MSCAEEITGATKAQVFFRNFKAVVCLTKGLQAALGLRILILAEQDAEAFILATAYPASQLMKLGKTEPVCIFDDHQGGIWHIHAHLHHGGSHQNICPSMGEGTHNFFFFRTLHLSME